MDFAIPETLRPTLDAIREFVDERVIPAEEAFHGADDFGPVEVEMQAQLQLLLERAKTVEQSLEIRKALDSITLELESARAQMRSLAESVAFSTLTLRLSKRGPSDDLPSTNDPFSWVDRLGAEATEFR